MNLQLEALESVLNERERQEVEKIVNKPNVIGYAIFDRDGITLKRSGITDTVVAIFSTISDLTERVGVELGELTPRPAVMFSSKAIEMVSLPLEAANVLFVKDKSSKMHEEFSNAN
jgi:hypothetical protein